MSEPAETEEEVLTRLLREGTDSVQKFVGGAWLITSYVGTPKDSENALERLWDEACGKMNTTIQKAEGADEPVIVEAGPRPGNREGDAWRTY